jgi:hypothetical protein
MEVFMKTSPLSWSAVLATGLAALQGCGDSSTGPTYDPGFDPSAFVVGVSNPFIPMIPGTVYTYETETEDGTETIVVEVLTATRSVAGVTATVIHDQVFLEGELIEDTFDWYGQDVDGNVWYLGENSKEIEDGEVVSTEGSWETGVDGALPGIIMWANPEAHLGEDYRQEYYKGEAEDWARVVATDQSVTVPFGSYTGCLKTEEWNGLEKDSEEDKYYCPGIGGVLEVVTHSNGERVELVSLTGL